MLSLSHRQSSYARGRTTVGLAIVKWGVQSTEVSVGKWEFQFLFTLLFIRLSLSFYSSHSSCLLYRCRSVREGEMLLKNLAVVATRFQFRKSEIRLTTEMPFLGGTFRKWSAPPVDPRERRCIISITSWWREDGVLTWLLDKKCFYLLMHVRGRSGVPARDVEMKSEITSVVQQITNGRLEVRHGERNTVQMAPWWQALYQRPAEIK